jgi:hypothetical protein
VQGKRALPRRPRRREDPLAISLAIAAAADLITSLEEAQAAGRLSQRPKTLIFPGLLVVDEIGYLPLSRTGAMLFFQLMSRRYEHAATVLTSNKRFEQWGEIFGDDVMASALIDRLVHLCRIVNIRGNRDRRRQHADLQRPLSGVAARRLGRPKARPPRATFSAAETATLPTAVDTHTRSHVRVCSEPSPQVPPE